MLNSSTCAYSRPLASCTEKTSGVWNWPAAGLSSSRSTITACRADARVAASSCLSVLSFAWSRRHIARLAGGAAHQEVALAIDRTEARLLDLQQRVGQLRYRLGVAEVRLQHLQLLALRGLAGQALPEQGLDGRPGEEVGVDDLVASRRTAGTGRAP